MNEEKVAQLPQEVGAVGVRPPAHEVAKQHFEDTYADLVTVNNDPAVQSGLVSLTTVEKGSPKAEEPTVDPGTTPGGDS
jgi:hypothetical protein